MRGVFSGLTTRGRCLLAAGVAAALCSAVLNERDLLRVGTFVIVLPILASLYAASTRIGLAAVRTLLPTRASVDSSVVVQLEVHGGTHIPTGGLLLEDGVPYALGSKPRFLVERLRRNAVITLRYPLRPVLRGVHQVGPVTAMITDPFGLAEFERKLGGHSRLIVAPKVVPLSGVPGGTGLGSGDTGMVRLRAGQGEDDAIIRPYRHGDDLRKVHWRSTARRDELMVRVEERPWRGGTTVLLDRRSAAHRGGGAASSLEWAVSFAASVCLHLHHHGHRVRLATEDGRVLAGGTADGGHSDANVLDALAALQPSHRRELVCGTDPGVGQELIAVLGAATPTAVAELMRYRPRSARSLAVLLDVAAWAATGEESAPDAEAAVDLLRGAGWGVVVARPDQSIDAVWAELCRRGAGRFGARAGKAGLG
jgi:uncharacterized protein (DUF58 family)